MLSWFFRKRDKAGTPASPAAASRPPSAPPGGAATAASARPGAGTAAALAQGAAVDWPGRLQAAQGDDAALLALAAATPLLDIKMAAVQALEGEAALRQAERRFRDHDRKVHRLAKQRLEAAVAQREARAAAQALLDRAAALLDDAAPPINHVVELDRAWERLPAAALQPAQTARFVELRARLDAAIRERGEAQQRLRRWTAQARQALLDAPQGIAAAAAQGVAGDLAGPIAALAALRQTRPEEPASVELDGALAQALQTAAAVEARLRWLETAPAEASDDAAAPPPAWHDLPAAPDAELARLLDLRHERWLRDHAPAVATPADEPPMAVIATPRPARDDVPDAAQRHEVEEHLQQAERALADGHLDALQQQLQAIDGVLGAAPAGRLPTALRTRLQALRAEGARLKGWKQWGGARARDDLAAEAEALARHTQAAADPAATDARKLNLHGHAASIQALRQRWKALDRQGAAASQAQWQRFDAALQLAFEPVAAQHAALEAARRDNLAAREVLLAPLEALALPADAPAGTPSATPSDMPAAVPADPPPADAPVPDWKQVAHELAVFQAAWRKLGPVEHTVPAAARQGLQQRLQAAVERVAAPLRALQQAAAAEREQLIVRAQALSTPAGGHRPGPESVRLLRELQAQWQEHARRLPLPRAVEGELWGRFRAASDAVFAQREAVAHARDAALAGNLAACETLLARLQDLPPEAPPADIERRLAEVDRGWRQSGELPRGAGEALEARFRAARADALRRLDTAARQRWRAQCDALATRLARCESGESVAGAGAEAAAGAPPDLLPAAWAQALAQRPAGVSAGPLPAPAVDELLLQLETALDLPITPARQDERRQQKLRALKDALEGRAPARPGAPQPAAGLVALLRQRGLAAEQRERLHAIVAALRQAPPGALGVPMA